MRITGNELTSRILLFPEKGCAMDLSKYDGKHIRITDQWNETFTGLAAYANADFLECEYGGEEDGLFIGRLLRGDQALVVFAM